MRSRSFLRAIEGGRLALQGPCSSPHPSVQGAGCEESAHFPCSRARHNNQSLRPLHFTAEEEVEGEGNGSLERPSEGQLPLTESGLNTAGTRHSA